jgi:acetyltransferase-like isoleucine patch superfamily enzyme
MVFGQNKLKYLSLKTIYQIYKRRQVYRKNKTKHLIIGLGSGFRNTIFGNYNYIGGNCSLTNVTIGDYSYINSNSKIRDTKIGKFCSIASNVKIVLGSHPTHLVSLHPAFYTNNKAFRTFADKTYFQEYYPVEIGNDVWIGENTIIPGGIKIGDGAIIATGSVVTKDVAPYTVVGGVPAKLIKSRFNEEQVKILLNTKWWDKEESWLKKNFEKFHSIDDFIAMIRQEE